jgi:hypothetical protein
MLIAGRYSVAMKRATVIVAVALLLAGCESGGSESERKSTDAPAAQTVRDFYDAANRSAGKDACAVLTDGGLRTVVHTASRDDCIQTIDRLDKGSFESDDGDLLEVEGVDERGSDEFDVDAVVKGRTAGTFHVVERGGRLLIDGFEPEEG